MRTYNEIAELLRKYDPESFMVWLPGGAAGGGVWQIGHCGQYAEINVRPQDQCNILDCCYRARVVEPKKSTDYSHELLPDAILNVFGLLLDPGHAVSQRVGRSWGHER